MILTPHIIVGSAIGSRFTKKYALPILIILSLASHYLLDTIPHYEYSVSALENGLNIYFFIDWLQVLIDISAGLLLVYFLARKQKNFYYTLAGGLIALLPDLAIFLHWQMPNIHFFTTLYDFGLRVHYPEPKNAAVPIIFGIATQTFTVLIGALTIVYNKHWLTKKPSPMA